ncbi:transcriptional regulator, GntR family [Actinomadura mexicana]|uniref:Transcriptional regulator, GntR family n=1 Tax=Actinomadura mexicana TaxID=134959 RepID=A0A239C3B0_9ACTN|nr:transcriptional regulator, GntR family [Actinomadura mexicana]
MWTVAPQREVLRIGGGPPPLTSLSVAEAVAAQLRARILDEELADGSELPTEAVLLEEFQVSRPSLREAFRILETEGLVKVRRGKRGGMVVLHPTHDSAAYHVGLLLHSRKIPLADLAAARNMLEPLCAEEAARRRSHVSIGRKLASLCTPDEGQLEDGVAFTAMATRFHEELVVAAGNSTLDVLAGILESLWSTQEITWARSAVDEGDYPALKLRREVINAHLRISRAIENGDHVEAVRLTRGHLRAATPFVVSRGGQVRAIDRRGRRATPRG